MSISRARSFDDIVDPEDWVDEYGDYLYRYAFSRLRNASVAEDIVQDTFLAGVRYQHQFEGRGSHRGWLLGIMRRKIVDHVRMQARRKQTSLDEENDPTAMVFDENGRWKKGAFPIVEPDKQLEFKELWLVVQSCLERLPQGQADVFVLSVMEEMKSEEICKELEISPSNLWVRLHRARLSLAKCVGTKWISGGESGGEREGERG